MKVYVTTEASSPEDEHVTGVHSSMALAKAAYPYVEWGCWGPPNSGRSPEGNDVSITEYEVDAMTVSVPIGPGTQIDCSGPAIDVGAVVELRGDFGKTPPAGGDSGE